MELWTSRARAGVLAVMFASISALGRGTTTAPERAAPPRGSAWGANGRLDLARASYAELTALPGIGAATAEVILRDRERHGPLETIDDLRRLRHLPPLAKRVLASQLRSRDSNVTTPD